MEKIDYEKLAQQFMGFALELTEGENSWIEYIGPKAFRMAEACAEEVRRRGGLPHLIDSGSDALNSALQKGSPDQAAAFVAERFALMRQMQTYIRIKDDVEESRLNLPEAISAAYRTAMGEMTEYRVNNTRWLVVAAPTEEMAAASGMTYSEFLVFYHNVCLLNYTYLSEVVKPLQKLMTEGKQVHILAPTQETDLRFSIEGIPAVPCTGDRNIPDGECYTAPVRDSIEGTIKFGPSRYQGKDFGFIRLRFEKGRAVEATADTAKGTAALNTLLNVDEGARYVGEFSFNFNPYILNPTGNILFDEKIAGGIHLALGNCYEAAPNGNKSANHWDMVHIQRPEWGGGEVWIDGVLVRKDGLFVLRELTALNPENLKKAAV